MDDVLFGGARLLADIGGTNARFALQRGPGRIEEIATLACAAHATFTDAVRAYLAGHPGAAREVRHAVIAIANPVEGDFVKMTNHHWQFSIDAARRDLGLDTLLVVNDFAALSMSVPGLPDADLQQVGGTRVNPDAVIGVVGAGTGLGVGGVIPDGGRWTVLPSEGGHVALAPGSEREMALLQLLSRGRDYVHTGHVLSGPGLVNLYRAIGELDGLSAVHAQPEQISAAALDGGDALALDTLHTFCAMLGGFVGDLAVLFKASGGVFLAGGILPQLREFLPYSAFRERFFNKGVMRDFLAGVPVRLIEHGRLGVLGAAGLAARAEV